MKKIIKFFCLFITFFSMTFFAHLNVYASTVTVSTVNANDVNVRVDAGTQYSNVYAGSTPIMLNAGHSVTILGTKNDSSDRLWYNIQFLYNGGSYTGYMYGPYITTTTYEIMDDASFEAYLTAQGFPQSYWPKLKDLHAQHPNWTFQALKTNTNWEDAVNAESQVGKSLIYYSRDVSYRSTEPGSYDWDFDTWTCKDGCSWYAANSQVVAYYLDPRNFLNVYNIMMYESLAYQSAYQTQNTVQQILNNTFMAGSYTDNSAPTRTYAETFMAAAQASGVSPVHLASRVRQEQGSSGSVAVTGGGFTYNNQWYSGLYNFYNWGATSGSDAVYKGLVWANGGEWGTNRSTTYRRPWNSKYNAIVGGAEKLGASYINIGQNTLYLQKWDVYATPQSQSLYTNQYMTNIEAPKSESISIYNSYNSYGVVNEPLVFSIPVYNNMPESTSLPTNSGNPNNHLNNLSVNGTTVQYYDHRRTTYDVTVSSSLSSVTIGASKISDSATIVSGTGELPLTNATTAANVVVRAGNGSERTYTINIIKSEQIQPTVNEIINNLKLTNSNGFISGIALNTDASSIISLVGSASYSATTSITNASGVVKTNGTIATGDVITIANNNESASSTAVIYGDVNGDGQITILDLLLVQKNIMGSKSLSGAYAKAADSSRSGIVDIVDLLKIQKHILGVTFITQ